MSSVQCDSIVARSRRHLRDQCCSPHCTSCQCTSCHCTADCTAAVHCPAALALTLPCPAALHRTALPFPSPLLLPWTHRLAPLPRSRPRPSRLAPHDHTLRLAVCRGATCHHCGAPRASDEMHMETGGLRRHTQNRRRRRTAESSTTSCRWTGAAATLLLALCAALPLADGKSKRRREGRGVRVCVGVRSCVCVRARESAVGSVQARTCTGWANGEEREGGRSRDRNNNGTRHAAVRLPNEQTSGPRARSSRRYGWMVGDVWEG